MKTRIPEYLKAVFDKYKYILLLGLVGLLLMTWPENTQQNADAKVKEVQEGLREEMAELMDHNHHKTEEQEKGDDSATGEGEDK